MSPHALPHALDPAHLRRRIDATLAEFLHRPRAGIPARRDPGPDLTGALTDFVMAPAKRIRPLLCLLGWYAARGHGTAHTGDRPDDVDRDGPGDGPGHRPGGEPAGEPTGEAGAGPVNGHGGGHGDESEDPEGAGGAEQALRLAASLELFHAFALIHDDIMDGSDTRRGRPSVQRAFAVHHAQRADADTFGTGVAILLGDLALVRCDELLRTARLSPQQQSATLPLLETMRDEVLRGQYLDLLGSGRASGDVHRALTVIRLKTAKYTVERPLHVGAALAGADAALLRACSAFALPLGDAFQLRDDLLGTFGDPHVTGKPVLEDLRCGKATVLMALAVQRATPSQAAVLRSSVGDPLLDEDRAAEVRQVLEATGARHTVENMISDRYDTALRALAEAPFPPQVTEALRRVAVGAVLRAA